MVTKVLVKALLRLVGRARAAAGRAAKHLAA
jgi:hypothetical protein